MKGLHCSIFESKKHGNCSANGISSRVNAVTLCPDPVLTAFQDWGIPKLFEADDSAPAVVLRHRRLTADREHVYAVPVELADRGCAMFGGTFIYTSDSRFPLRHPIPLHDRVEEGSGYGD